MTNSTKGARRIKKSIPFESDAAFQMTQTRACLPTLAASAKTKIFERKTEETSSQDAERNSQGAKSLSYQISARAGVSDPAAHSSVIIQNCLLL